MILARRAERGRVNNMIEMLMIFSAGVLCGGFLVFGMIGLHNLDRELSRPKAVEKPTEPETGECGAYGPPNGWLCREPKGHTPGKHVYRPSDAEIGSERTMPDGTVLRYLGGYMT
jgi:hypothetical protein